MPQRHRDRLLERWTNGMERVVICKASKWAGGWLGCVQWRLPGTTRARLCYWSPGGGGEELPSYLLHLASSSAANSREHVCFFTYQCRIKWVWLFKGQFYETLWSTCLCQPREMIELVPFCLWGAGIDSNQLPRHVSETHSVVNIVIRGGGKTYRTLLIYQDYVSAGNKYRFSKNWPSTLVHLYFQKNYQTD